MNKYDRFDSPDPHADDYPMDKDDDEKPPAYEPPASDGAKVKKSIKLISITNLSD